MVLLSKVESGGEFSPYNLEGSEKGYQLGILGRFKHKNVLNIDQIPLSLMVEHGKVKLEYSVSTKRKFMIRQAAAHCSPNSLC